MNFIDVIVSPYYFLIAFLIAYFYKTINKKDELISRYFLRAYIIRIMGGLAFGSIYFFYYGGGDTFNYFSDSRVISEAIRTDFFTGMKLMFYGADIKDGEMYYYVKRLNFGMDPGSMFIARIAGFTNLFTFDSYVSTTILFSLFSFWGSWKLFLTLCKMFPNLHKELLIGCLYLPSIVFWTSGIMKDTICSASLCLVFCAIIDMVNFKKYTISNIVTVIFFGYIIIVVKIYIIMTFSSTIAIYVFSLYNNKIQTTAFRIFLRPVFFTLAILVGYYTTVFVSSDSRSYNLENIASTAIATADWIGQVSIDVGGSYYSIGALDFTPSNIPPLIVKAFIVTFYRPFLWEVYNPLMLFSSLEGLYFLYLTYLFVRHVIKVKKGVKIFTPFTNFCFLFSIVFAFGVGVVSNNFGTLARYKAPMLPFFVCGIFATTKGNQYNNRLSNLS